MDTTIVGHRQTIVFQHLLDRSARRLPDLPRGCHEGEEPRDRPNYSPCATRGMPTGRTTNGRCADPTAHLRTSRRGDGRREAHCLSLRRHRHRQPYSNPSGTARLRSCGPPGDPPGVPREAVLDALAQHGVPRRPRDHHAGGVRVCQHVRALVGGERRRRGDRAKGARVHGRDLQAAAQEDQHARLRRAEEAFVPTNRFWELAAGRKAAGAVSGRDGRARRQWQRRGQHRRVNLLMPRSVDSGKGCYLLGSYEDASWSPPWSASRLPIAQRVAASGCNRCYSIKSGTQWHMEDRTCL